MHGRRGGLWIAPALTRRWQRGLARQHRLDHRQEALHHAVDALGVGVHAVGQQQARLGGDAVEEERIERQAVGLGQARIDRVELRSIISAEIRRGEHAGQHDRDAALAQALDHRDEVLLRHLGADAAQHVVGAELEDDDPRVVGHRPVEAGQAAARRVAGNPGIGDQNIVTARLQRRFELLREGLARRKLVSGHQAVAEADDAHRLGHGPCGHGGEAHGRGEKKPTKAFESHTIQPISDRRQELI